jgi:NitT/TauT family transport system substrate-binding protein
MKFGNRRRHLVGAVVTASSVALALSACGGGGASASGSGNGGSSGGGSGDNTLTVSYSQNVADELPLWIADEAGYFKDQGLNVKLTNLSSSDGFPALISGQTQLASIGASEMVSGAASGAKVKYLATLTPVFPYQMFAKVSDPQQLKGKRIGVTSTSGSLYVATLEALKQLHISPKDVQLVTLGSVTNVNNALVSGTIAAAMSHPPATTKIEAAGYHSIMDLAKQKIPTSNVGIAATESYLSGHGDQVKKFLAGILKGIQREKSDKAYTEKVLTEHLKVTDQKALDETYEYYAQEVVPEVPTPTAEQLQTSKDELAAQNPKVKDVDVSKIVDASYLNAVK